MNWRKLPCMLLVVLGSLSCSFAPKDLAQGDSPYDFTKPDKVYRLPFPLNEISGLALQDSAHLLAINDEEGILFNFNLQSGEVQNEWNFGNGRDYEGVAIHEQQCYVVASDGDVVIIQDYASADRQAKKYENKLDSDNNVEGLCYVPEQDALLLACKDDPGNGEDDEKAVYAFDLSSKTIKPKNPVITVDLKAVEDSLLQTRLDDFSNQLRKAFTFDEDQEDLFRPSGIARHPKTGNIYILSAHYRMLVILDQQFQLKEVIPFENPLFRKPEGIAFNEAGDLYISNEANGGIANILYFKQLK